MEELIIDVPFMGVLDILAFYSLIIHDWLLQLPMYKWSALRANVKLLFGQSVLNTVIDNCPHVKNSLMHVEVLQLSKGSCLHHAFPA